MIKNSIIFSAHTIHELLRNTLILFVIIFIALFFWLKIGIQADSLVFGKYKVERLYIKLDKKFTLNAHKIIIPSSKKKPTFDNIDETFDRIKYLFTFFDEINLKNIIFNDNILDFNFNNDILHIKSMEYEINGTIKRNSNILIANISNLNIKKENININGNLKYNLDNNTLQSRGNFDAYHIKGNFSAKKIKDKITFKLNSKTFVDLKTLIHRIPMHEVIKSWIVDKVQAKKYTLNTLEGSGNIIDDGFELDFNTLKANAFVEGVKIYYQKDLPPILADSIHIDYKNRGLYFTLQNPFYEKRSLENSKVSIVDLGGKAMLKLDLHVHSPIDNILQKVLLSYHLNIPVKHKGKDSYAKIKIDLPLGKKYTNKKISVKVNVDVSRGEVWYKNIKLPIEKASVTFDNKFKDSLFVDAILKKGIVSIGKTMIPVVSGKGKYTKDIVKLEDVHIKSSWYDGKITGPINLKLKKAKLSLLLKNMTVGDKKKFILIKNKLLKVDLNYTKNLRFIIPSLDLKIENKT